MIFVWTGDLEKQLTHLWADGQSARAIAAMLGAPSRNSVLGKIHRMGLPKRKTGHAEAKPRLNAEASRSGKRKVRNTEARYRAVRAFLPVLKPPKPIPKPVVVFAGPPIPLLWAKPVHREQQTVPDNRHGHRCDH